MGTWGGGQTAASLGGYCQAETPRGQLLKGRGEKRECGFMWRPGACHCVLATVRRRPWFRAKSVQLGSGLLLVVRNWGVCVGEATWWPNDLVADVYSQEGRPLRLGATTQRLLSPLTEDSVAFPLRQLRSRVIYFTHRCGSGALLPVGHKSQKHRE